MSITDTLIEMFIGQIPEAIYFALFMIFTKKIKEHRILFIVAMIIEYVFLLNLLKFNIWSHIWFFIVSYCLMKMIYKEKCQITDIFILGIASLILLILSVICGLCISNAWISIIINRALMFMVIILLHKYLFKIQGLYKKLWNREKKTNKKIKSATFRSTNLVIFNLMFYAINLCILAVSLL